MQTGAIQAETVLLEMGSVRTWHRTKVIKEADANDILPQKDRYREMRFPGLRLSLKASLKSNIRRFGPLSDKMRRTKDSLSSYMV